MPVDAELTTGWSLVGLVGEGDEIHVRDVNPWQHRWTRGDGRIRVSHPQYPHQRHLLDVWQIETNTGRVTFAAGELSNGAWCFYTPDST